MADRSGLPKKLYPILEYDPSPEAVINPSDEYERIDIAEHCVICFFPEVIEKVGSESSAQVMCERQWECGTVRIYEHEYEGKKVAFCLPGVGAPMVAAMLEFAIALGCRKFVVCGSAGVLDSDIPMGQLLIPTEAVRDEGVSYHYLPPSREVAADPEAVKSVEETLKSRSVPYMLCKTWTTDGVYRETSDRVNLRREEGCLSVEMEAASLFAVAQFRKVRLAQILYGGDDVAGEEWDKRGWKSTPSIRENLFWLATEAVLNL